MKTLMIYGATGYTGRLVAEYLQKHHSAGSDQAFGLWRATPDEGVTYQERLRREWDERNPG